MAYTFNLEIHKNRITEYGIKVLGLFNGNTDHSINARVSLRAGAK